MSSKKTVPAKKSVPAKKKTVTKTSKPDSKKSLNPEPSQPAPAPAPPKEPTKLPFMKIASLLGDQFGDTPSSIVVDKSANKSVATFLKYREATYFQMCNPSDNNPEKFRMAILGAIRFGNAVVVDFMDAPMAEILKQCVEGVEPGLWLRMISGEFLRDKQYETLIREKDGELFDPKNRSNDFKPEQYRFLVVTTAMEPPRDLVDTKKMEVIIVE